LITVKRSSRPARTVVCATDLTETGNEALRQAFEVSRERKARLVVLHVMPNPLQQHPLLPLTRKPRYSGLPEAQARAGDAVRAQMERALGREPAAGADVLIEHGRPHAVIIERAEAVRAELIVVGGSASKVGREAERVVRYAHAPVLVARPNPATGAVLAATDFSDAALPAVAAAVDWAHRRRAPIALLHVVDLRPLMMQLDFGAVAAVPLTPELQKSLIDSARKRLDQAFRRYRATGRILAETGEPAAVILAQARRIPARLLVMGTAGATGLKRMVLGSVAEAVVHRAPCSTLVVRLHTTGKRASARR
jgi:nucleotide-binding universal stress UspA family protein